MKRAESLLMQWDKEVPSSERHPVYMRLPVSDHQRLKALQAIYKNRSINDFLCDFVNTMLDEVIESLPIHRYTEEDVSDFMKFHGLDPYDDSVSVAGQPHVGDAYGPRIHFNCELEKIRQSSDELQKEEVANS